MRQWVNECTLQVCHWQQRHSPDHSQIPGNQQPPKSESIFFHQLCLCISASVTHITIPAAQLQGCLLTLILLHGSAHFLSVKSVAIVEHLSHFTRQNTRLSELSKPLQGVRYPLACLVSVICGVMPKQPEAGCYPRPWCIVHSAKSCFPACRLFSTQLS